MTYGSPTAEEELATAVPESARRRLRDMLDSRRWSSQLTAGEQAALAGVGFQPAGQVMGASVWSLNQTARGNCGGTYGYRAPNYTAAFGIQSAGGYADPRIHPEASRVGKRRTGNMQTLSPLIHTYTRARRSALRRLQGEAAAVGADGVVGVRLTLEPFSGSAQRSLAFVAIGTAVRSIGATHLAGPFLSDLDGNDLALLLRSGWAPTGLVMGVGAVVVHDSYDTVVRRRRWSGNVEMAGYSDLATQARVDARARLNEDVRLHSGEAAVLGSSSVSVHEQRCSKGGPGSADVDHLVEAVMLGTAISRFERPEEQPMPAVIPMIRLSERTAAARAGTSVVDPLTIRRGR